MSNLAGIDLGTTNSLIAFKLVQPEVVTADDNRAPERTLTPSVVAWEQNGFVVGEKARNQSVANPEKVVRSIKRLMGRDFDDPNVQDHLSQFSFKVTQHSEGAKNSISVWLDGKEYQPGDISAEILKKVVQNAQNYLGKQNRESQITHVVVTIPAYFNDKQRHATEQAIYKAGLEPIELLSEPTAAAISYGFKPDESDVVKTILVYDFGGGTFDCSLITAVENRFIESGKAGDLWLGGDDIDSQIIKFVLEQVAQEWDIDIDSLIEKMPESQRLRFMRELSESAEQAKISLSGSNSAHIIPNTPLIDEEGMVVPVDVRITREQFEKMIEPMIDRTIAICLDALKFSDYPLEAIDIVLMVGGSSQIPLVQRKLRESFGQEKVVVHPRPMYAVAEGAAIVAASGIQKVITVGRDYFIELVDKPGHKIIERGEQLPVSKKHTFTTEADGQCLIHLKFFTSDQVSENINHREKSERIGDMWLVLDQPYPKGTEISLTAELDEKNSSLHISACLKHNPSVKLSTSFLRGNRDQITNERVEKLLEDINKDLILTEYGVKNISQIAAEIVRISQNMIGKDGTVILERKMEAEKKLRELQMISSKDNRQVEYYISTFKMVLELCPFLLSETQKSQMQDLVEKLQKAKEEQDLKDIQTYCQQAQVELENLLSSESRSSSSIQLILFTIEAIEIANHRDQTQANLMSSKLGQVLNAMERGNEDDANILLRELLPYVEHWVLQDREGSKIYTGIHS